MEVSRKAMPEFDGVFGGLFDEVLALGDFEGAR
jgi:hypothetical protein